MVYFYNIFILRTHKHSDNRKSTNFVIHRDEKLSNFPNKKGRFLRPQGLIIWKNHCIYVVLIWQELPAPLQDGTFM